MRTSISAVFLALTAAGPAQAQADQVRRGPAPAWTNASALLPVPQNAGGPVFLRRQDVIVHLDEHGQSQFLSFRAKVLHPSALQLGNLTIAWNPAAGAPVVHAIRVYRDGQAVDVLEKTSFDILRREDQLDAAKLDGMLTAVLRVPDLRVGDELEVSFTTRNGDPTLGARDAGILFLPPNPAPGRYHMGLSWAKDRKPAIKLPAYLAAAKTETADAIDVRVDNPAPFAPVKDAPARYQWARVLEFSNFADWAAISRHFAPLYVKAATLPAGSPLKREAKAIAAANATPLARASAALKLVQQDVRYVYVGLDGGNLLPASADQTWERRYGDCKGKTALLLALLGELGIAAEPVLVNTSGLDDGLNDRLPSPRMFDHVLVRAHIDGATWWLDGTLPPVAAPTPSPVPPLKWVLPLSTAGGSIEQIPWRPAATPEEITLFEVDARAGFDKPARIINTTILRGLKGLQQQAELSALAPGQLLTSARQTAIGDTWQTIEDVQWRYDGKAAASVLTIVGVGRVNWDDDGDGARSLALAGGGFSPPDRRIRPADQD